MKLKEHTRNQKRMYRIHKQEEKIQNLELLVGKLQQENKQLKEIITKALNKIDNMFNEGNDDTIIDDLLELERILEGSDSNE